MEQDTMNLNSYQQQALTTAVYPKDQALDYTILGLCGEAGELANLRKKHIRKPIVLGSVPLGGKREQDLADELGDVLWYAAAVAYELGFDLEAIAQMNLNKLAQRAENGTLAEVER